MNIEELKKKTPVIEDIAVCREVFWNNPNCGCGRAGAPAEAKAEAETETKRLVDIDEAEARLLRFAPFIEKVYPEVLDGIIESDLTEIPDMQDALTMDT